MARYKDIELLDCMVLSNKSDEFCDGVSFVLEQIDKLPTADVVEVVRCQDCVHLYKEKMLCTCGYNKIFGTSKPTFSNCFCCYGERRDT